MPQGKRIKVRCVETGKVYDSLRQAERDTGVSQADISRRLMKHYGEREYNPRKVVAGKKVLHFRAVGDYELQRRGIPCQCIETGEIFPSMHDASRAMGKHPSAIYHAIKDRQTCGGLHFVKLMNFEYRM